MITSLVVSQFCDIRTLPTKHLFEGIQAFVGCSKFAVNVYQLHGLIFDPITAKCQSTTAVINITAQKIMAFKLSRWYCFMPTCYGHRQLFCQYLSRVK